MTPLMPIVFLFSAIVSGIALVMLLYMALTRARRLPLDLACLDTIARYLFYAFIIDFSHEMLDLIHRVYEADESFHTLDFMVKTRLYRASRSGVAMSSGNTSNKTWSSRRRLPTAWKAVMASVNRPR